MRATPCKHRWYRNFMVINLTNSLRVKDQPPNGAGAEHLCIDCGMREWEPLTGKEAEERMEKFHRSYPVDVGFETGRRIGGAS